MTDQGITVYPARCEGDRWRAVWYEPDGSRGQCQSVSQQGLAARLEKVTERLAADVPNMLRSGGELIGHYLSDDRHPAERAWSRRHADTQRYLCARYLEPVIGQLASQDIRVADMQAVGVNQRLYELMVNFAAYTGLRWGELIALPAGQISQAERVVTVDGKVVEVRGHLFAEAPKNRKRRRTIYPRATPAGWPLAEKVAARIAEVAVEQASGRNPLGLMFPTPAGKHWRSSNFNRRVLKAAYLATGWRGADSGSRWTWHSLRHVFCTTALNTWGMDVSDVSRLAGHANVRVTLEMYVGSVAGALERARRATD